MTENTKIEWATHSWNPWIGCQKVSAGCDHCYAETMMANRYQRVTWGQRKTDATEPSTGTRVRTSPANWKLPIRWATRARLGGDRPRVFCASLADVFDNQVDPGWRRDLFSLIALTPELDWLLLTKRPENMAKMIPSPPDSGWPWPNIWFGTTCEDQAAYDRRWPILREIPAWCRFISYEPAIGPLTIRKHEMKPDWLICGGESGPGHRDMPPAWANNIGWDCKAFGVPFFMKQMAGKRPIPPDLLVREFPKSAPIGAAA